jgi:hypothetical protein
MSDFQTVMFIIGMLAVGYLIIMTVAGFNDPSGR